MSDHSVAGALRSSAHRVVIEAPAGTGKTHQAASYARDAAHSLRRGERVLILAHTHAACDVFASRTAGLGGRLQIGTIDALVAQIAKAYHRALGLPADIQAWSIDQGNESFSELARRVRDLLVRSPAVAGALAQRFPVLICDEHQDASDDQHTIVEAVASAGSLLRVFGDPMQAIFTSGLERQAQQQRWQLLREGANELENLDTPHRWSEGSPQLGAWVLAMRAQLAAGGRVELRGRFPGGLVVIRADNQAQRHGGYQLSAEDRRPLDVVARNAERLLILTPHNATVRGLNAFWNRSIRIWEGYTRDALGDLLTACRRFHGNPIELGRAFVQFMGAIGIGFTPASFGDRIIREIETACAVPCRGKPAQLQALARLILEAPSHLGVGAAIDRLQLLMNEEPAFRQIKVDLWREFNEARRLHTHPEFESVVAQLTHQRTARVSQPPARALSSVHKSKGLETRQAIVIPCDTTHFADNEKNRCLLYVALSRSSERLFLVVPRNDPSPLLLV